MSRGPGHIQRQVLDYLREQAERGWTYEGVSVNIVAHWLSDVHYADDTEPTRAQLESARRALARLEQDGRLVSTAEVSVDGIGRPPKWYRLPTAEALRLSGSA